MVIQEFEGLETNKIFDSVSIYLGSKTRSFNHSSPTRLIVTKPENEPDFLLSIDHNQEIIDLFEDIQFKWVMMRTKQNTFNNPHNMRVGFQSEHRSFELTFDKKHKEKAIDYYLPHIINQAKLTKEEAKAIKLYTTSEDTWYGSEVWQGINLNHPSTFDTLAIDEDMKRMIVNDLDRFVRRREYYKNVGKAWKRGYLLYGPPGTGKSSLIAAMANYLKFDVYDLELTALRSNSDLRRVLVGTANRSILVVEDIDCSTSIELKNREEQEDQLGKGAHQQQPQVTLSGLLNFIDGLWSSCGDERIIIFTTNHKEKLDPALMRPGRMDMHIHMSYCTPDGFKLLARNYLGGSDGEKLMREEIEKLIDQVKVTPAEVAEQLMRMDDPEAALEGLMEFLRFKMVN